MNTMKARNRWQELTPKALGVLLIIVPFVFGIVTIGSNSWSAWVLGAVVGVVSIVLALLWFGFPGNRVTHGLMVMVGVVLFFTPWVMGESLLSAGALLVIGAARMAMESQRRQAAAPAYRPLRGGSMESETSRGYR
jgi:membrane-bound ClpP family serine protease